jgi:arginine utilization regulatory protein
MIQLLEKGGMEMDKKYDQWIKFVKIYEHILDEINEGVHVVDEHGVSILYNRKMVEMESMVKEDVLNRNLLDVFQFQNNQGSTLLQALHEGKSTKNVRQTYFNQRGKEITTINHTFPVIEEGKIIGAIEIANDITKMERMLKEKNSLEKGNTRYTFESIIGQSQVIQEVVNYANRTSRTTSSVLITGETGSGKEMFAQGIHNAGLRSNAAFISQNCAALPDTLIESLLFGTSKGAFTGAIDRIGLFEQAKGGTLFLDEIDSLSPPLQAKLLRAIQEKTICRLGDIKDRAIDVRIIAAINEDPVDAISHNRLRKDLFYRLGVVTLFIPPLRDRIEDISLLVDYFIHKYNKLFQMEVRGVTDEVMQFFLGYDWPGNVRELQHMIEGAMNIMTDASEISYSHLPIHHIRRKAKIGEEHKAVPFYQGLIEQNETTTAPLKEVVEEFEKYYILKVLEKNKGNISRAANELNVSRQSLQYHLRKQKKHIRKKD